KQGRPDDVLHGLICSGRPPAVGGEAREFVTNRRRLPFSPSSDIQAMTWTSADAGNLSPESHRRARNASPHNIATFAPLTASRNREILHVGAREFVLGSSVGVGVTMSLRRALLETTMLVGIGAGAYPMVGPALAVDLPMAPA